MPESHDEPDLLKHIRNVLEDTWNHGNDGPDEGLEAIVEHPEMKRLLSLKVVGPLDR